MKRIVISMLCAAFMPLLYAVEPQMTSFGAHFSIPLIFESASENGVKTKSDMTSIGFGFHGLTLYTEKLGIYTNLDIVFPQTLNTTITYGSQTASYSVNRSDYDSIWGMSALLAPAICVASGDKGLLAISPGIHYAMLFASTNTVTTVSYLFGLGAAVQGNIFLSSNAYISLGADLAYDFLGFTLANGSSKSGETHECMFTPRVGLGLWFK